jgi:gamma-glutamylaminecyclotransferase
MTRIFVYGTLKRGGANHFILAGQQFLGPALTPPGFTLYSLGDYPGMVRAADDRDGVKGELWAVDVGCLLRLDKLEGVAEGLYGRVPVRLAEPHAGEPAETYLYLCDLAGKPAIGSEFRT